MNWVKQKTIRNDEQWSTSTPLGDIRIEFTSGELRYFRDPISKEEAERESVERTVLMDSQKKQVSIDFIPLYPDRPMVFEIENLAIPPGDNGFFCLTFEVAFGVSIKSRDLVLERLLTHTRKNSFWGQPDNGLLCYREKSLIHTDPNAVMTETDTIIVTLPVYYRNRRDEGAEVTQCLVPLDELTLYKDENDDLIYEVIELEHIEEFYQEPRPIKRPPKELSDQVARFITAPSSAQSLFEKVKSLPRLDTISNIFLNR